MRRLRSLTASALAVAVAGGALVAGGVSAEAAPDGSGLVISEAYLNGGSAGATYRNKFVEVHNPTDEAVDVSGWSVQYRAYSSTSRFTGVIPLGDRRVPAGGTLLVSGNSNAANGEVLPTPDVSSSIAFSGNTNGGTLALVSSGTALEGDRDAVLAADDLVDLVGYGASTTFEGAAPASGYSVTSSLNRTEGRDTDDNAADLTAGAPTPTPCGAACDPEAAEPVDPTPMQIAEIQGPGASSPVQGDTVVTTGVVTAAYPTGGFDGVYLQTAGTGGEDLDDLTASHAVFVSSLDLARDVQVGDHVEVVGVVEESFGLTRVVADERYRVLDEPAASVKATELALPLDAAERERLESMLVAPVGDLTVTDNYSTHQYGEIGLASGTTALPQPTDVERPGTEAYRALVAENERRLVTLDDGRGTNFLSGTARNEPAPWLRPDNEVRVGAPVTVTDPVILDFRFGLWRLQPTAPLTAEEEPATFGSTRSAAPSVDGDVKVAAFNVLNYFVTTGADYEANGLGTCTYYTDRAGAPVTVNRCTGVGPRGAADDANLARQEAKIVAAINSLEAEVVALQEIENSAAFGIDRDTALRALVAALNEDAGRERWSVVASPADVPQPEDVIRTAFIHDTDAIETVGESVILDDPAFDNARDPLAQTFRPVGAGADDDFVVINNHFKSKGSGTGEDADAGDGQGASNASRVRQAQALTTFAAERAEAAGTDLTFLTGDFNSYSREDPVEVIRDAGFVDAPRELDAGATYLFGGRVGSLDHVFVSEAGFERVTDAAIWNINAVESVAREYSRFNGNVTNLYDASVFRASDHDPVVVGFSTTSDPGPEPEPGRSPSTITVESARIGLLGRLAVTVDTPGRVVDSGLVVVQRGFLPVGFGIVRDGRATVYVAGLRSGVDCRLTYSGDRRTAPSSLIHRVAR
ncbi:hypothetical protein GCM10009821_07250 [Aeromicrobium halocynthiae]|uniref:LTD domain-containing protein n=1 Tax=Aeromicrobium halocynthiae TaxID=560557 RepID=A0ABN2VT78_9ACTN